MDTIDWEEIVSIEYIEPDQNEMVYDFSVEDIETFTTKEGIVVHNTLNSIDYNEKIVIRVDKKYYKVIKIGDFIEDISSRYEEKYKTFIEDGDQTYIEVDKQCENYEIYAVDFNGRYKWCSLQAVTKHLPLIEGKRENLVKITLESGRCVTGTRAKSFLKFNEKIQKLEQCGGDSISIGDYVPIMKTFNIPSNDELIVLHLTDFFPKSRYIHTSEIIKAFKAKREKKNWFKNSNFIVPHGRSDILIDGIKKRIKNGNFLKMNWIYKDRRGLPDKFHLDEMFGFFIGAFLAEGLSNKNQIKISNNNYDFRQKIYDFCDKFNIPFYTTKKEFGDEYSNIIKSYTFRTRDENINDKSTTYKEYPKTKNYRNGTSTDITIYHTMLADLMHQLCNSGSKNKSVPEFCYLANKIFIKSLLDGYLSGDGTINKTTFSYTTISKDLGDGIALLLKRFGIHTKIFQGENKFNTYYTFTLKNYENFKYLTLTHKEKLWRMYKMINKKERGQNEFQNNILEKVIKKEYVESSHNYVYDLTVKDNINFILFNSISVADTFHSAGVSSKLNVNQGVPRLEEIISVTRYPKAPSQKIYLKDPSLAMEYITQIPHLVFYELVKDYKIYYDGQDTENQFSPWYIEVELDEYLLFEKQIEMIDILTKLSLFFDKKNLEIVVYPDNETTNFRIYCKEHSGIDDFDTLKWAVEQFDKITLLGIEYIQNAFYNEKDENIQTNGSNMREILSLPFVDSFKTITNDIHDMFEIFGIESARYMIVQEINNIMEFNGITLDVRHVELLADVMTSRGFIMSTDRHGLKKNDGAQVLARASYEESVDMLAKAAIFAQVDELKGITANILVGQVAPSGTGDCELLME